MRALTRPGHRALAALWACGALAVPCAAAATGPEGVEPSPQRQQALVRLVRQDCGSCHGMRLTGGLGPALTREALSDKAVESMAATIFHGRRGTPMPGWAGLLSEPEALWVARQLAQGFPEERGGRP